MPLHARLAPLVTAPAAPETAQSLTVAERRALAHAAFETNVLPLTGDGPELWSVTDHEVDVDGATIPVRLYRPSDAPDLPAHVYFHGGAFWIGTIEHFDMLCRRMARDAQCAVLSVGYRLAPEHKFPTQPEDCFAAVRWLADRGPELGIDPARLCVGGASAGATLAAAVTLMSRERGGPALVGQVLEIPLTTLLIDPDDPELDFADGPPLDRSGGEVVRAMYLADPEDASHPWASPLLATDLHGLPPALVMTAEYDLVTPTAERYAQRLIAAGVPVVVRRWLGQMHGTQHLESLIPDEAAAYHQMVVDFLRAVHQLPGT